jgi:DNA polymerase-3 subunit gamma/tau
LAVWEIDGASNNSVDNVRELIDSLRSMPPPGSKYKIYIIDEVHMLSTAAFNALLKSLEEPPPNTVFIFATTDPQKIPETVISRCQRYDFHRLKASTIIATLKEICEAEGVEVDEAVLEFVAHRADGGLRDAQSMFDRVLAFGEKKIALEQVLPLFGAVDRSFFFSLSENVFAQDAPACLELIHQSFSQGLDLKSFVTEFVTHWRNLLLVKLAGDTSTLLDALDFASEDVARMREQLASVSDFQLQRLFDVAELTADKAMRSSFPRFVIEAGVAKMATLSSLKPIAEIISELKSGGISLSAQSGSSPQYSIPANSPPSTPRPAQKKTEKLAKPSVATEGTPDNTERSVSDILGFNPSWEMFLKELKSRGALALEALLKRVNPKDFRSGSLTLEGSKSDLQLIDAEQKKRLEDALGAYSGVAGWSIKLLEAADDNLGTKNSNVMPGSLVDQERQATKAQVLQTRKEAREAPALKRVLSTFEGARVEKINVLKSE